MDYADTYFWPWPCHYRRLNCFYQLSALDEIPSPLSPISTSFVPSQPSLPLLACPAWLLLHYFLGITTVKPPIESPPGVFLLPPHPPTPRWVVAPSSWPSYYPAHASIMAVSTHCGTVSFFFIRPHALASGSP